MHFRSILTYSIAFVGIALSTPSPQSAPASASTHSPTSPASPLNSSIASNSSVGISATFPSPSFKTMYACSDPNFSGACFQFYWYSSVSGCINALDAVGMQDTISSATPEAGRTCVLYEHINCGGASLYITTPVNDLSIYGFADITTSYECY